MESTVSNITENALSKVLQEFLNIEGVDAVALVGRDGFVIDSVLSMDVDIDAVGAMVATVVGASESFGQELKLGTMEQYLAEFSGGKVIMSTVKDDILAVFTNSNSIIGSVRFAIRQRVPKVISLLR